MSGVASALARPVALLLSFTAVAFAVEITPDGLTARMQVASLREGRVRVPKAVR